MRAGTVVVGGEMVVMQKYACYKVSIRSIQIEHTPYERLDVSDGQEIGLQLTNAVNEGSVLIQEPSSTDILLSAEAEETSTDTESL